MITFYPVLKETLCYLLGSSWVPTVKVGMTATPKESEDTFFLKPAIRQQASSGTRHCIGCQIAAVAPTCRPSLQPNTSALIAEAKRVSIHCGSVPTYVWICGSERVADNWEVEIPSLIRPLLVPGLKSLPSGSLKTRNSTAQFLLTPRELALSRSTLGFSSEHEP